MAYQPAGNLTTTSTLTHLATVYYDRTALDQLRTKYMFRKGVDEKVLPKSNGKTIQWYRYSTLGANTTPKVEGTVGTSLQLTSTTVSATISQYADYISFSDLLTETAIDDVVDQGVQELSARAGLTVDNLIKAEIDSAAASIDESLVGSYFSAADCAKIHAKFAGVNVRPKGDSFPCLAHPYVTYDFLNDPAVGGFQDIVKQDSGARGNSRLFDREDRGFVAKIHGVEVWESTNVTVNTGASPDTHRIYFFGAGGVGAVDLAGAGPSRITDPQNERFKINVVRPGLSAADPEGVIAAYASYNFKFVAKILDSTTYRIKKIDATSSIIPT